MNSQTEDNKAIAWRFFDEAFNKFNLEVIDELLDPHYVRYDPAMPEGKGIKKDVVNFINMVSCGIPDVNHVAEDVMAVEDKVITRFSASATHSGPLMGIQPTGKNVRVTGVSIDRLENGKIIESWVIWDTLGLMQQIEAF